MCRSLNVKPISFKLFNTTIYHKTEKLYKTKKKGLNSYYKYIAKIAPKQGFIEIYKVIYAGININNLKFKSEKLIKIQQIEVEIPLEIINGHKHYNESFCNSLCNYALEEFNTHFIKI